METGLESNREATERWDLTAAAASAAADDDDDDDDVPPRVFISSFTFHIATLH